MFSNSQIKEAHAKVKSGADFPTYVQDLIQLGVKKYDTFVTDGHSVYTDYDEAELHSDPKYPALAIAGKSNSEKFNQRLKLHQQGGTDYPTFCQDAADCGVEKWTVDMQEMTCTYYDKAGNSMKVEVIPLP